MPLVFDKRRNGREECSLTILRADTREDGRRARHDNLQGVYPRSSPSAKGGCRRGMVKAAVVRCAFARMTPRGRFRAVGQLPIYGRRATYQMSIILLLLLRFTSNSVVELYAAPGCLVALASLRLGVKVARDKMRKNKNDV